ncbi:hypothetical protein EDC65_0320 [Stella humosa]|uniref:Tail tube GTA-gp10-like protein n=1 Tax=Stella humosa TaxID=94 RepID=A0A3N1MBN5_9PROT|nr:hypothetical protein [Stella humosa]ROQ01143.1 hypothetical protein EDC65_0320 [Stella humosa]BBK31517.1 hypothetical protein STHU_21510 [Stella humosa]
MTDPDPIAAAEADRVIGEPKRAPTAGTDAIVVTLDGAQHVLHPSLTAALAISRAFGGLVAAREAILRFDLDAIETVILVGMATPAEGRLRGMESAIYRSGFNADLIGPLVEFIGALMNGGRPLPDLPEPSAGQADGGH